MPRGASVPLQTDSEPACPRSVAADIMDSYVELTCLIDRLHRITFQMLQKALHNLDAADLSAAQFFVLLNIGAARISVNKVINRTGVLRGKTNRMIATLIQDGYVL